MSSERRTVDLEVRVRREPPAALWKKVFNQSLSQKCTCSQKSTRQPDEVGCSGRAGRHFQRLHIPVVGAGSARGPAPNCLQIYCILACVPVHKVELVKVFQDSFKTCWQSRSGNRFSVHEGGTAEASSVVMSALQKLSIALASASWMWLQLQLRSF